MHVRLHLAGEGWPPKLVTHALLGSASVLKIEGTGRERGGVLVLGVA